MEYRDWRGFIVFESKLLENEFCLLGWDRMCNISAVSGSQLKSLVWRIDID